MDVNTEKIKQERFVRNNGRVLRGINVLRTQYVNLFDLKSGLPADITYSEYCDCVNYLQEIGYINVRHKDTHGVTSLADTDLEFLEAKLSGDGIKFLAGRLNDSCVGR